MTHHRAVGAEHSGEATSDGDGARVVQALLHSAWCPEQHVPEGEEHRCPEQQARNARAGQRRPDPRGGANGDEVQDDWRMAIPAEDGSGGAVEHRKARPMRTKGRDSRWIGDLADRVVAAIEAGASERQRLMPVGHFVVDYRPIGRKRDAEEVVHEDRHQHRDAGDAEEHGRTATDNGSHEPVRYHERVSPRGRSRRSHFPRALITSLAEPSREPSDLQQFTATALSGSAGHSACP